MAEDNTVTEAKTLIRNLISQIHNQDLQQSNQLNQLCLHLF